MRQGIIVFAEAPAAGSAAEKGLKATVDAALRAPGVTPFLAYAEASASQKLRTLVGGPPPRFFPQATRNKLGERIAQAFAFLFVQDYEQVALVTTGYPGLTPEAVVAALDALGEASVHIEEAAGAYLVALRRADFPAIAPIFEEIRWEAPGARASAEALLSSDGAKA
jgi:glycosyltransferase A (GT-A) superfamily protein (DUF2064 family)